MLTEPFNSDFPPHVPFFLLRTLVVMARAAVIAGHSGDLALIHKNNHLPSDYLSINTEATHLLPFNPCFTGVFAVMPALKTHEDVISK